MSGLSSAVVGTATIGIWDKVEPWPVNELDRAHGYDAAFAISNVSGNILTGVASGGAGCWAKGAGTAGKVAGYGLKTMDIGGNIVGGGKSVYDMYDNGPNISNVIGLGGNVLGLAGNVKMKCFTAGTQIVVGMEYDADGVFVQYVTVNIEDIKVGDLVYSYNTLTGETELCEVTATFVRSSDHINLLTIVDEHGREQVIETTDGHPFWVVTNDPDMNRAARDYVFENGTWLYHEDVTPTEHGYWVEAKDLRIGDVFLGANGELSTLVATERPTVATKITVYNFTVEGNHNYFVLAKEYENGQTAILVHNAQWYDLTDFRKDHILNRHRYGMNKPGKTEFPQNWPDDKILHEISDVATDPNSIRGVGKWGAEWAEGVRDGVNIHVDFYPPNSPHYAKISTAYPF